MSHQSRREARPVPTHTLLAVPTPALLQGGWLCLARLIEAGREDGRDSGEADGTEGQAGHAREGGAPGWPSTS